MNERYTHGIELQRIGTSPNIKVMDPTSTEELNTTGEECSRRKPQDSSRYYVLPKLVNSIFCLAHGNAEL